MKMLNIKKLSKITSLLVLGLWITSCGKVSESLNVYSDSVENELGERSTAAISSGGNGDKAAQARHALEVMGSYQRALAPQPYFPVVNPAEIRLMWIPDHLNKFGDLVPAHFYYLRVLPEGFAVQDAFEIEKRLDVNTSSAGGTVGLGGGSGDYGSGANGGGATPWQYLEKK